MSSVTRSKSIPTCLEFDGARMIRAVLLLAASSACEAFRTTAFSTGAVQTPVTARDRRPARAADVVMGDYTLDNMVLDGPLQPLKDQVSVRPAPGRHEAVSGVRHGALRA